MADLNKQQVSKQDFHHNSPGFAGLLNKSSSFKSEGRKLFTRQLLCFGNDIWAKMQCSTMSKIAKKQFYQREMINSS